MNNPSVSNLPNSSRIYTDAHSERMTERQNHVKNVGERIHPVCIEGMKSDMKECVWRSAMINL